jgi:predicted transcriptional regulator
MNPTERAIYEEVRKEPGLHLREYVRKVPQGYGAVASAAQRLARHGLLSKTGRTVSVRYWPAVATAGV